jgi:hypothetical protein
MGALGRAATFDLAFSTPERPRQNPINTEEAMPAAITLSDAALALLRQIL